MNSVFYLGGVAGNRKERDVKFLYIIRYFKKVNPK